MWVIYGRRDGCAAWVKQAPEACFLMTWTANIREARRFETEAEATAALASVPTRFYPLVMKVDEQPGDY